MKKLIILCLLIFAGSTFAQYPGLWKIHGDSLRTADSTWFVRVGQSYAKHFFTDSLTLGKRVTGIGQIVLRRVINSDVSDRNFIVGTNLDNAVDSLATLSGVRLIIDSSKVIGLLHKNNLWTGTNTFSNAVAITARYGLTVGYQSDASKGFVDFLNGDLLNAYKITLTAPVITASNKTITLPNETGTILLRTDSTFFATQNWVNTASHNFSNATASQFWYNLSVGYQADASKGAIDFLNGDLSNPYKITLTVPAVTGSNKTITMPNTTGTIMLRGDSTLYATHNFVTTQGYTKINDSVIASATTWSSDKMVNTFLQSPVGDADISSASNWNTVFNAYSSGISATYYIQTSNSGGTVDCWRAFTFTNGLLTAVGTEVCH